MTADKIGKIAFFYLFAYSTWRFIFTHTIFQSSIAVYSSFILLLILFSCTFLISKKDGLKVPDICALSWIPFASYISIRFLFVGQGEFCIYWIIFQLVLCLSSYLNILDKIPYKFIFFSGVFILFSIFLQVFFQSIFDSIYSAIFIETEKDWWVLIGYGYTGFTYQLGRSSEIIMQGIFVLLFWWFNKLEKNKWIIITLILMIIGVFLTGKRTNSAIVCVVSFIAFLLKKKLDLRRFGSLLLLFLVVFTFVLNFVSNASEYVSSPIFCCIASSIVNFQHGIDFESGRNYLRDSAIRGFEENPFWGIGPEKFRDTLGLGRSVHNIYYQVICELGMVGLILFLAPLVINIIITIRFLYFTKDIAFLFPYVLYSFFIQISFIIGGLTENVISGVSLYIFYAVAISILIGCKKIYLCRKIN